eukprot:jgi/Hompol1/2324/HPOL_005428-RA
MDICRRLVGLVARAFYEPRHIIILDILSLHPYSKPVLPDPHAAPISAAEKSRLVTKDPSASSTAQIIVEIDSGNGHHNNEGALDANDNENQVDPDHARYIAEYYANLAKQVASQSAQEQLSQQHSDAIDSKLPAVTRRPYSVSHLLNTDNNSDGNDDQNDDDDDDNIQFETVPVESFTMLPLLSI